VAFRLTSAGESSAIDASDAEKLHLGEIIYTPNFEQQVRLKAFFTPEVNIKKVVVTLKQFSVHG